MNDSAYSLLGRVVWRAGKWYLRRTYGHLIPSRRTVVLVLAAVGLGAAAFAGRRLVSP